MHFNRHRLFLIWNLVVIGGLGFVLVGKNLIRTNVPPLPLLKSPSKLPAGFDRALVAARNSIRDPRRDVSSVRKLACLYQANRFYNEARICYEIVDASRDGLNARDHYYLALMDLDDGDLQAAQVQLRALQSLDRSYLPARVALANVLYKSGQEAAATAEYTAILTIMPNHSAASIGLARLELASGHDDAGIARLERLLAEHPEAVSAAGLLSQVLNRRGESKRAAALALWSRQRPEPVASDPWKETLLTDCYDKLTLAMKVEDYLWAGQYERAVALIKRVEELDPTSWIPHLLKGWSETNAGHKNEAAKEYRKALASGADPDKICPLLASTLISVGTPRDAMSVMAEYHTKKPDSLPILSAYADAAIKAGDEKTALELVRLVIEKEPYDYTSNMNLAKLLWDTPQRAEAVPGLERVAEAFPEDIASRGLLGQYFLEQSKPLSALPWLEQALPNATERSSIREQLVSLLHSAYMQIGGAAVAGGDFVGAITNYDKALVFTPGDLNALAAKADACVQAQLFHEATEVIRQMITIQPTDPTLPLSLGDILYQIGEVADARANWLRAEKLLGETDTEMKAALMQRLSGNITAETFK